MSAPARTLDIASSPHIRAGVGVERIMFNVVLALLPVVAFAVYAFGHCKARAAASHHDPTRA